MPAAERFDRILDALRDRRFLSVEEAVALTGASPASIRRDFSRLAKQGALRRVRGGVRPENVADMLPFEVREARYDVEKQTIARHAAGLLRPGDVVIIDGGTTTFHLAANLPPIPLRIITNSLPLAHYLDQHGRKSREVEVFLTGGFLYPNSGLLVGPGTRTTISQYRADWVFLSVGGITVEGLHNTNELVVETERQMIASAARAVVLADHSKIGRHAMCQVVGLEKIHLLITDQHAESETALGELRARGLEVVALPAAM